MRFKISWGLTALLCIVFALPAAAVVRTVPVPYASIQDAVDASQPGDKILISPNIVGDGLYHENVLVTTENIRLEGINGATLDGTGIQTPTVPNAGITITADDVTVNNLTVQNFVRAQEVDPPGIGIYVDGVRNSDISDNTLQNNEIGLKIEGFFNSEINQSHHVTGNVLINNTIFGAQVFGVDGQVQFAFNTVANNGDAGLNLLGANGSKVRQNEIYGNGFGVVESTVLNAGILVGLGGGAGLRSSVIRHNSIHGNAGAGVFVDLSEDQTINNNDICGNGHGIGLNQSFNCTVRQNDVAQSLGLFGGGGDGIFLDAGAADCTIASNTSNDNTGVGIHIIDLFGLGDTANNTIRNNCAFNNALYDAHDETGDEPGETLQNTWKNNNFGTTNPAGLD